MAPVASIYQPGDRVTVPALHRLREDVARLLGRSATGFPGAQPVSFARKHLTSDLHSEDYYVCEKSDGVRYLLYFAVDGDGREAHFLIDRKNDYWAVPGLHFPTADNEQGQHPHTLIDGELVLEEVDGGGGEPHFLVFDCLILDGKDLRPRTLDKRLGYFKDGVMRPYTRLFERYPEEKPYRPFVVEMKSMQLSYGIEMMFREVLPQLRHGNDGLIFTCRTTPYQHGTDEHILKWKAAEDNTIDFRLRLRFHTVYPEGGQPFVDYDGVPVSDLMTFTGRGAGGATVMDTPSPYKFYAPLHLDDEEWEELKSLGDPLNNRIVECGMDDQKRWRLHRFRDDKGEANHVSVVTSVMESINDAVSKQELMDGAKEIKESWKARDRQRR